MAHGMAMAMAQIQTDEAALREAPQRTSPSSAQAGRRIMRLNG